MLNSYFGISLQANTLREMVLGMIGLNLRHAAILGREPHTGGVLLVEEVAAEMLDAAILPHDEGAGVEGGVIATDGDLGLAGHDIAQVLDLFGGLAGLGGRVGLFGGQSMEVGHADIVGHAGHVVTVHQPQVLGETEEDVAVHIALRDVVDGEDVRLAGGCAAEELEQSCFLLVELGQHEP